MVGLTTRKTEILIFWGLSKKQHHPLFNFHKKWGGEGNGRQTINGILPLIFLIQCISIAAAYSPVVTFVLSAADINGSKCCGSVIRYSPVWVIYSYKSYSIKNYNKKIISVIFSKNEIVFKLLKISLFNQNWSILISYFCEVKTYQLGNIILKYHLEIYPSSSLKVF